MNLIDCCEEPLPVDVTVYEKDIEAFMQGKNVAVPAANTRQAVITLVQCDSCKTILGRLPRES